MLIIVDFCLNLLYNLSVERVSDMRYLLGSDYDGTLCKVGVVTEKNVMAIEKFRSYGNCFCVVTGRDYAYGYLKFKTMNVFSFDYLVLCNGALCCDNEGNIVFSTPVEATKTYDGKSLAYTLCLKLLKLTNRPCGFTFEKTRYDFHPEVPHGGVVDGVEYNDVDVLLNISSFVMANARTESAETATPVTKILCDEFSDVLNPIQNGFCIDITAKGINKAGGLSLLAEKIGIKHENIWTAGDNYNDVEMLRAFNGCAMKDGVADATVAAKYVCENVSDIVELIELEKEGNNT